MRFPLKVMGGNGVRKTGGGGPGGEGEKESGRD